MTDCFPDSTVKRTKRKPGITKPAVTLDQRRKRRTPVQHQVKQLALRKEPAKSRQGILNLSPNRFVRSLRLPQKEEGRSPREVHSERVILESAHAPAHSALGSGLRNLVGILDGSALVLSPDTGPLHMAVALNRPVVSLLGYTNPKRTGPYRRYHDLIIDAYGEPGEDYPISMENRRDRMPHISVRDVLDRVERWRSAYKSTVSGPKE